MNRLFIILVVMSLSLGACVQSPYYQKSYGIKDGKWGYKTTYSFDIDINDTQYYYNTLLIVRHTNNYKFANLWMNVWVKGPGDTQFKKSAVDFLLATPQGQWLGLGAAEIYEQRRLLVLNHEDYKKMPLSKDKEYELIAASKESFDDLFTKKGRYTIKIEQNMRENVLSDILNIGLRVERYVPKKQAVTNNKLVSKN